MFSLRFGEFSLHNEIVYFRKEHTKEFEYIMHFNDDVLLFQTRWEAEFLLGGVEVI